MINIELNKKNIFLTLEKNDKGINVEIGYGYSSTNDEGYTYMGLVYTNSRPNIINAKSKIFYITAEKGVYQNFGIKDEIDSYTIIKSLNGNWFLDDLGIPFEIKKSILDIYNELNSLETKDDAKNKLQKAYDYTNTQIAKLIDDAPETLDTLYKIAQVLKENEDIVILLQNSISNKVDKEAGKGLSTNDFTDDDKTKLKNIEEGAQKNNVTEEEKKSWDNKQDSLTEDQLSAVNSGIDEDKVKKYNDYKFLKADANNVYTKEESDEKFITEHQDLSEYVKKDEISDLINIDDVLETIQNSISNKVDKEAGKGLSTNDFTDDDKTKLLYIDLLMDEVFPINILLSSSIGAITEFTGENKDLKLSWNITRNNNAYIPDNINIIKKDTQTEIEILNSEPSSNSGDINTFVNNLGTTSFILTIKDDEKQKSKQLNINSILPMFYGFSTLDSLLNDNINKFNKVVNTSFNGILNPSNPTSGYYFFVAVPQKKVTRITSNGFDVLYTEKEDVLNINGTSFNYNIAVSTNPIQEGIMPNVVISIN